MSLNELLDVFLISFLTSCALVTSNEFRLLYRKHREFNAELLVIAIILFLSALVVMCHT